MGLQRKSKKLSVHTRTLLAEGESERVDFKRSADGISAEDLVAFANTDMGGDILIGVEEHAKDSAQIGVVRGCDVSDATILQILNKAVTCVPPVSVDVFIENLDSLPILRISVASGSNRPHCTPKGVYCRRDGSRNRALHPGELLRIFLHTEAQSFAQRFESAATRITRELKQLEKSLDDSIQNMSDQLGWVDSQFDDTETELSKLNDSVDRLTSETDDVASRLRVLFRQDKRVDPVTDREKLNLAKALFKELIASPDKAERIANGERLKINVSGKAAAELVEEDVNEAYDEAVARFLRHADLEKYAVVVDEPKQFTAEQLERFGQIVAAGGEVAAGVRNRIESAYRLGIITYEGQAVGTAALKKPLKSYRAKVFDRSGSEMPAAQFPYELGWIFLGVDHRRKGQMTRLLAALMPLVETESVFATTRADNDLMREMLIQLGFVQSGAPYNSNQQENQMIELYVRSRGDE